MVNVDSVLAKEWCTAVCVCKSNHRIKAGLYICDKPTVYVGLKLVCISLKCNYTSYNCEW